MKDLNRIEQMTLREYCWQMLAYNLREVDEMLKRKDLAWSFAIVQNVDEHGDPEFKNFDEFFDYQKALKAVYDPQKPESEMNQDLVNIAKRHEEYLRRKEVKHG